MDTKYIEMCRENPKLQHHKPQEGDHYSLPNGVVFVVASYCLRIDSPSVYLAIPEKMRPSEILGEPDFTSPLFKTVKFEKFSLKYWTWLPTQAQLQDIIYPQYRKDCCTPYRAMIVDFEHYTDDVNLACYFDSMEQFWLAFIMYEKYNKVWNGKDWITK